MSGWEYRARVRRDQMHLAIADAFNVIARETDRCECGQRGEFISADTSGARRPRPARAPYYSGYAAAHSEVMRVVALAMPSVTVAPPLMAMTPSLSALRKISISGVLMQAAEKARPRSLRSVLSEPSVTCPESTQSLSATAARTVLVHSCVRLAAVPLAAA
ncbi:hypothetical protein ACFV2U_46345 [Streptomyces sp. NPDC059697]|uniref:hypothetical protein n=1 Tax=Streptomyces sp. NPDC059697 TaxID=3346912 RepID=UPI00368F1293